MRCRRAPFATQRPDLIQSRAALLGLLTVTLVTVGTSGVAGAHANFLRSDPAPNARLDTPPVRVVVGFSEKVTLASSGLAILDQTGREPAAGGVATADPTELALPFPASAVTAGRGAVYTVAWHTVSAEDGDPAKGYFSFVVGALAPASGAGTTQSATQANVSATLTVWPLVAGENTYTVSLVTGGAPLPNVSRVRLRVTPQDRDIGQSEIVLVAGGSSYAGRGLELPFAGRYRVQVQVRRSDTVNDLSFDFDVQATAAASQTPTVAPATTLAASGTAARSTVPVTASPRASAAPADEPMVSPAALAVSALLTLLAAATAIVLARRRA